MSRATTVPSQVTTNANLSATRLASVPAAGKVAPASSPNQKEVSELDTYLFSQDPYM